jgi:hypothetical protein
MFPLISDDETVEGTTLENIVRKFRFYLKLSKNIKIKI